MSKFWGMGAAADTVAVWGINLLSGKEGQCPDRCFSKSSPIKCAEQLVEADRNML